MDLFIWDYFVYFFPRVLSALPTTLAIVIVATIIGTVLGIITAILRVEKIPIIHQILGVIVSFLRGTPIYVQLFLVYFGVPIFLRSLGYFGISIDRMLSVYIAYGLNAGAFLSETFRSAIISVPQSQIEAAYSIGLTKFQVYRRVVLPQAARIAIPGYGNTIVALLQNTSIAFTIGIIEMLGQVRALQTTTFRSLEGYVSAAIIFVILSIAIDYVFKKLETRASFSAKGLETN